MRCSQPERRLAARACEEESFLHLMYRYIWPDWLFRDASVGSALAQAAAYRHNREQRDYLGGYIAKWAVLLIVFLHGGGLSEEFARAGALSSVAHTALACGLNLLATWALIVVVVFCVTYVFLSYWEH
jgi:hypothetical protein